MIVHLYLLYHVLSLIVSVLVLNVSVLIRCLTEQQLTAVQFLVLGIDV